MAKCDLHIEFDRDQRLYKLGEAMPGKVIVVAHAAFQCRKITLVRAWKTSGRGNETSGGDEGMILDEGAEFQAGEKREYPFQFGALRGPVSYQGHLLNVEWVLRAQVDLPAAVDVNKEEKFALGPGEIAEEILLGTTEQISGDYYETTTSHRARLSKAEALALPFLVLGVVMMVMASGNPLGLILGLAVSGFGLWQLYIWLRNRLAKQKLGAIDVHVSPDRVRVGNRVECQCLFKPHDLRRLNKIMATLKCEERVMSGSGSLRNAHAHTIYETTLEQTNQNAVAVGEKMQIAIAFQIPPHSPCTFHAPDNAVNWHLRVQLDIPGWPDWIQDFPLTVLPPAK